MSLARFAISVLALLLPALGGCVQQQPSQAYFGPGQYAAAFQAATDVVRDADFSLERVDAQAGVITTREKATGGLGTPWDQEQTTANQEVTDWLHRDSRTVRVTFEPENPAANTRTDETIDPAITTRMRVSVVLLRRYQPGWRVSTAAVRASSHTIDPALEERTGGGEYSVAFEEDRLLAGRLTTQIVDRIAAQQK